MDPLTLASSFATIVGLLSAYKNERQSPDGNGIEEFVKWMNEHGFVKLTAELEKNTQASHSIEALLSEETGVLLARLEHLDQMLASVAAHVEGLAPLALALRPEDRLSAQAISFLTRMEAIEASAFTISVARGRPPILLTRTGSIEPEEPRFLEDDLASLVETGLLRLDYTTRGKPRYVFTRAASRLVRGHEQ